MRLNRWMATDVVGESAQEMSYDAFTMELMR